MPANEIILLFKADRTKAFLQKPENVAVVQTEFVQLKL